jgi:hypothetical protein
VTQSLHQFAKLLLSVASDGGHAHDFPRADRERQVVQVHATSGVWHIRIPNVKDGCLTLVRDSWNAGKAIL